MDGFCHDLRTIGLGLGLGDDRHTTQEQTQD